MGENYMIKKRSFLHLIWLILLFWIVIAGLVFIPLSVALAQGPPPRPGAPPGTPGGPPGRTGPPSINPAASGLTDTAAGEGGGAAFSCSTLHGVVINWGYRNEPQTPVQLTGYNWQDQKVTDDNGYYAFDCLGNGIGMVNLVVPPGSRPVSPDVALRLGYWPDFEVNLGFYNTETAPALAVTPTLTVSAHSVLPGQTITYTLGLTNTTPSPLSRVLLTDLLPTTLVSIAVTTTVGSIEVWDNLLTADIGELAPTRGVSITVAGIVSNDTVSGALITHRASLLYTGHIVVPTTPVTTVVVNTLTPTTVSEFTPPTLLPETGANLTK
jgi:uncharacterized repeat protein (TIGR01451 family)